MNRILFEHPGSSRVPAGTLCIIVPSGELPIEDVAQKDVPAGVPFIYATAPDDLPEDREFRGAWEADFSNPDGEGIGADAWFAAHPPIDGTEVQP